MMADNQLLIDNNNNGGGDDDVFVYTGGDQEVPRDVKRVRIAEDVDTIPARKFEGCEQLIEVEGHNRLKKIEEFAFNCCYSLRRVTKMQGVTEIEMAAFLRCHALSDLEFGKLEIIGVSAIRYCESLRSINLPSIRRVGKRGFQFCRELTDVVFGEKLERIEAFAFWGTALRRIVIPLKDNLHFGNQVFNMCGTSLSRVDVLDGGIHETIPSLHMESWRNEMQQEIDRINQTLPNTHLTDKTETIRQWIDRVLQRMEYHKSEHMMLVKEAMALLELALWKAKLINEADERKRNVDEVKTKKAKIDVKTGRKEHRVTCGASIVIKNVLPFLALK
jgi:hypothetical protein